MKRITQTLLLLLLTVHVFAQKAEKKPPANWFNLDPKKDKVPGVSTERAYKELLSSKKSAPIIVAVIDGGTDIYHEDLKDIIWTNKKEIPSNEVDDDKNGYVDDVHGWNFIGGPHPDSNVKEDTYELTRLYGYLNGIYEKVDKSKLPPLKLAEYEKYERVKKAYEAQRDQYTKTLQKVSEMHKGMTAVKEKIGKKDLTADDVTGYKPTNEREERGKSALLAVLTQKVTIDPKANMANEYLYYVLLSSLTTSHHPDSGLKVLTDIIEYYAKQLNFYYNINFDTRKMWVHDNYEKNDEIGYGNYNVKGPSAGHGSHVAGIIAAMRNNNLGIMGVADNVQIMVLRVVPDGDERDKDVANAIRYAADNGAKIINMSFGKSWSWNKKIVDEAAKYASDKDVLLVHAAGNDGNDLARYNNFPNDKFENTEDHIANWLEVGASSWKKGKTIAADFSNYGEEEVDVFAPGVDIYSTVPDLDQYDNYSGTSMAAPVAAGVAALIRSYYPNLTASQVKEIMMKSVIPVKGKILVPGSKKEKIKMKKMCVTGGIINAYEALKLAATYK